jgi:hypothetical protein
MKRERWMKRAMNEESDELRKDGERNGLMERSG